jgi:hypothetical protein
MKSIKYAQRLANRSYGDYEKLVKSVKMISLSQARIRFFDRTSLDVKGLPAQRLSLKLDEDYRDRAAKTLRNDQ